jgi:hypothetical protein
MSAYSIYCIVVIVVLDVFCIYICVGRDEKLAHVHVTFLRTPVQWGPFTAKSNENKHAENKLKLDVVLFVSFMNRRWICRDMIAHQLQVADLCRLENVAFVFDAGSSSTSNYLQNSCKLEFTCKCGETHGGKNCVRFVLQAYLEAPRYCADTLQRRSC